MVPHVGKVRGTVLQAIHAAGMHGRTCDEIEEVTGLKHQTASARVRELADLEEIVPIGTRLTRSGRKAVVWACA